MSHILHQSAHFAGASTIFLMASLDHFWKHWFRKDAPFRTLIDRLIARPVSLMAGHFGYGTEITVYAVKQQGSVSTLPRATVCGFGGLFQ
jgi:hypothetical protein